MLSSGHIGVLGSQRRCPAARSIRRQGANVYAPAAQLASSVHDCPVAQAYSFAYHLHDTPHTIVGDDDCACEVDVSLSEHAKSLCLHSTAAECFDLLEVELSQKAP